MDGVRQPSQKVILKIRLRTRQPLLTNVLTDTLNLNFSVNKNYNFDVVPHSISLNPCENVTFNFNVNK
jgi:hypothetical protein